MILTPEDIDAIADAVVRKIRNQPADSDPWLTRQQAAAYLNFKHRTFDRLRKVHTEALKPYNDHPLRWSRNALDVFKMTRGVMPVRRGRKPNNPQL